MSICPQFAPAALGATEALRSLLGKHDTEALQAVDEESGWNALHRAVYGCNLGVMFELLRLEQQAGADRALAEATDREGLTAFELPFRGNSSGSWLLLAAFGHNGHHLGCNSRSFELPECRLLRDRAFFAVKPKHVYTGDSVTMLCDANGQLHSFGLSSCGLLGLGQ